MANHLSVGFYVGNLVTSSDLSVKGKLSMEKKSKPYVMKFNCFD